MPRSVHVDRIIAQEFLDRLHAGIKRFENFRNRVRDSGLDESGVFENLKTFFVTGKNVDVDLVALKGPVETHSIFVPVRQIAAGPSGQRIDVFVNVERLHFWLFRPHAGHKR